MLSPANSSAAPWVDQSQSDPRLRAALDEYYVYQRRVHELQRAPTREQAARVYTENCRMIFVGRNPIIGRTFQGIDDWLTVYTASFGIVDHVEIEKEYTEAVGAQYAFNHDTHNMVVKGDTLRFERISMLHQCEGRIDELRILEYDQFAFDDFLRKHHPLAPTRKRQWRAGLKYAPVDTDSYPEDGSGTLRAAVTAYLDAQPRLRDAAGRASVLAEILSEDAEIIIQGRNPLGYGVFVGVAEWSRHLRFIESVTALSELDAVSLQAVGQERAFVLDTHRVRIGASEQAFPRLLVLRQDAGRICQVRILYFDPYAFDDFVNANL